MRRIVVSVALTLALGIGVWCWIAKTDLKSRPTVSHLRERASDEISELIQKDLARFVSKAEALKLALAALVVEPNATFSKAVEAWRDAQLAWRACEWTCFGRPAELFFDRQLSGESDPDRIMRLLQRSADFSAAQPAGEWLEREGNGVRGLAAIAWLLARHGGEADRALLRAQGAEFARRAEAYRDMWLDGGVAAFKEPSASAAWPWASRKEALDALVNRLIALVLRFRDRDLAPMVGATAGGAIQTWPTGRDTMGLLGQELEVSYRSLRDLYSRRAPGFAALVAASSPRIDESIRRSLERTLAAMAALPTDLDAAVAKKDPRLQRAYEAATGLKIAFGADLAAALDTTLSLSLNDGD